MNVQPPEWVRDAVFYQIFPDRFCNGDLGNDPPGVCPWGTRPDPQSFFGGDLWGILEKLEYIQDLGATALYLTPIFKAPTNHKYDTDDYFQVDPAIGGDEALRKLVSEIHTRGMRIVLDGVFNHCGEQHPFFQDAFRHGRISPYWNWFTIQGDRIVHAPEPNYACFAGIPSMPEWNLKNPAVQEYLLSVIQYWLQEFEIDGWRLDCVEYLPPDFVRDVYKSVKKEDPDAYVLGEVLGVATSWFKLGALDGVMHYKLWEALVHFFAEGTWDAERFAGFVRGMWRSYPLENNFSCYTLLGSHDKPRFLTLCRGNKRRLIVAAAFLFAFPGAPAIYYGDEIGMEGGEDPDCRRTFPWEESRWDVELRETFRTFIRIRQEEPALRRGTVHLLEARRQFLYLTRNLSDEEVCLALNVGEQEELFSFPGRFRDLITGESAADIVIIPAMSFKILKRRV